MAAAKGEIMANGVSRGGWRIKQWQRAMAWQTAMAAWQHQARMGEMAAMA